MKRDKSKSRKVRILIIDDDPLVGESLRILMEKFGFEPVIAPLGLAALDITTHQPVDLVIADIRMPGMNGIATLKAVRDLRRQFEMPPLPEMILTAYEDPQVRGEAQRMGIHGFFLKPFDTKEFLAAIQDTLRQRGIRTHALAS